MYMYMYILSNNYTMYMYMYILFCPPHTAVLEESPIRAYEPPIHAPDAMYIQCIQTTTIRSITSHQVSVKSIETVASIGVIVRLGLLVPNIVHYLMLPFTWDLGTEGEKVRGQVKHALRGGMESPLCGNNGSWYY